MYKQNNKLRAIKHYKREKYNKNGLSKNRMASFCLRTPRRWLDGFDVAYNCDLITIYSLFPKYAANTDRRGKKI